MTFDFGGKHPYSSFALKRLTYDPTLPRYGTDRIQQRTPAVQFCVPVFSRVANAAV